MSKVRIEVSTPMPSRRAAKPDAMHALSEADFQKMVVDAAHLLGWRTFAVRKSAAISAKTGKVVSYVTNSGWPDLVLWKGSKMILWELKSDSGKLSPEQALVLASLEDVEDVHRVGCVWPRDWNEIVETLRDVR